MAATTRKTKVMDVVTDMGADVVAEQVVTIPHKLMKMPTLGRTRI